MVPIQELVLGPKRLSHRERDLEVERYTRSYKNASDKKAVGFLANLKIDIRERQEAVSRLNKFWEVEEDGSLGDFDWARGDTKKEITAFVEFISEESEDGRRKMLEHWDQ